MAVSTAYTPEDDRLFIHVGDRMLSASGAELDALLRQVKRLSMSRLKHQEKTRQHEEETRRVIGFLLRCRGI
jgi:hypothetical protein